LNGHTAAHRPAKSFDFANIDVIYTTSPRFFLGLKGVSLALPKAASSPSWAPTAPASRRLNAISNLLRNRRREVTQGADPFARAGRRPTPNDPVRRGCHPGDGGPPLLRPSHGHENLLTRTHPRRSSAARSPRIWRSSTRNISRGSGARPPGRLHPAARADDGDSPRPDDRPTPSFLDEPDGPGAVKLVEESSSRLEPQRAREVSILLAEANTNVALRYALTATSWRTARGARRLRPPLCARTGRE